MLRGPKTANPSPAAARPPIAARRVTAVLLPRPPTALTAPVLVEEAFTVARGILAPRPRRGPVAPRRSAPAWSRLGVGPWRRGRRRRRLRLLCERRQARVHAIHRGLPIINRESRQPAGLWV